MGATFSRAEMLSHLIPLMHDPKSCEALQAMSDAQLRIVAETLDDLSKWKPERRDGIRKAVMRRVHVSPAEGMEFRTQQGLQQDVSDQGIGIFLNRPIPVGTRIKVTSYGKDSFGTVRRCQHDKEGWAIGVLLDQPVGSTAETRPEPTSDSAPPPESPQAQDSQPEQP